MVCQSAVSQTYYPMVKDSMMDFVRISHYDNPNPPTILTRVKKYRGDTLINGKTYIQVFELFHHNNDSSYNVDPSTSPAQYIGAVRDSNKQVFGFSQHDSVERLLYDFNLSIGDSVSYYSGWDFLQGPYKTYLHSVDSVLMNFPSPHYRKRYNYGSNIIIEGIGSLGGFSILRTTVAELVCVRDKNTDVYKAPFYADSCSCFTEMILSQNEIIDFSTISIFPNPSQSNFMIDLSKIIGETNISVFDYSGRVIIDKEPVYNSKHKINISNEKAGVYFVRITIEGQSTVKKLIKY